MAKSKTLDLNWESSIAKQGPKYLVIIPAELKDQIISSGLLSQKKLKVSLHLETIPEATN